MRVPAVAGASPPVLGGSEGRLHPITTMGALTARAGPPGACRSPLGPQDRLHPQDSPQVGEGVGCDSGALNGIMGTFPGAGSTLSSWTCCKGRLGSHDGTRRLPCPPHPYFYIPWSSPPPLKFTHQGNVDTAGVMCCSERPTGRSPRVPLLYPSCREGLPEKRHESSRHLWFV